DRGGKIAEFLLRLVRGDLDEIVVVEKLRLGVDLVRLEVPALSQERLPVGGQRPVKRRDRGEQALLKIGEQEMRLCAAGRGLTVIVEQGCELQLWSVRRQTADPDRLDD